jgi:hypothetical protein
LPVGLAKQPHHGVFRAGDVDYNEI